LLDINELKYF